MPLRMLFTNPIALAVITVAAIGVITYQILSNRKRVPIRGRRGSGGFDDGSDGHSGGFDDGSDGRDIPDETPGEFSIYTSDDNRNLKVRHEPKSETKNNISGVRRRNVATPNPKDTPKIKSLKSKCDEAEKDPDSIPNSDSIPNRNSELSTESSRNPKGLYPAQQNKETQTVENNISQVNSNKNFVPNINDHESDGDDSDSSESNNSFQNLNKSMDLDESICSIASCSTTSCNDIKTPSPIDSSEEIYKRDVCSYLKADIAGENCQEGCFSDEESVSENNFSITSEDSNIYSREKPDLCKGCLEEFANAVAYPCKHCYLCLDCAVKVHRIFKKCTICSSVIKTFEQL